MSNDESFDTPEPGLDSTGPSVSDPPHQGRRARMWATGIHTRHWSRGRKAIAATLGMVLAGGAAYAATSWTVGLGSGSSANAQGAAISNLVISDINSAPTETNQLSPGGTGDVTFHLQNPNNFLVTVTGVTLPEESISASPYNDAVGYTTSALSTAITGCQANATGGTPSTVIWKGASSSSTVPETLSTAFTVAAGATITVTMTNDASMDTTAPLACAGTSSGTSPNLTYAGAYFVMPALYTVTATGGVYSGQPATIANGGSITTGY